MGWLAGWLYWLASLLVGRLGWLHGGLVWKRATLARLAGWLAGWLGGGASTKVGRGLFESHLDGCWPSRGGDQLVDGGSYQMCMPATSSVGR